MTIELSTEQLKAIVTATGLSKTRLLARYINTYKEQLEAEANKLEGKEQNDALDAIPEKIGEARAKIKQDIKGKEITQAKGIHQGAMAYLKPLLDMNLMADGNRIEGQDLLVEIQGHLEVRNPKPENLKDKNLVLAYEGQSTEGFKRNFENIKAIVTDSESDSEYVPLKGKFPVNKYLGAIDISKKAERIKVYNFWDEVGDKYEQFNEDLVSFFLAVERSDLPDELQNEFDKLYNNAGNQNLEYVAKFEDADVEALEARHRFFNIVAYRAALDGLDEQHDDSPNYKDEISHGDINAETTAQILDSFGNSSTMGDTINLNEVLPTIEWEKEYDNVMAAADPLLIYESNRGTKLLAITSEMYQEMLVLLNGIEEAIDDGKGVSLDTSTDIQEWFEEVEDTMVLDAGDLKRNMALPISVLNNVEFAKLYSESSFDSVHMNQKIGLDAIDNIKNFFEDLYELLTSEPFMAEVANRSTKGRRRGGKPDRMEARRMGFDTGSSEMPSGFTSKGKLKGGFKTVQEELHKMLSSAIDYYFDPIYAGVMPIQIPNFASSIGSKVMQTLALDLGLETSMSKTYDTFFRLSAEEVDVGDLKAIANFLENIFVPSVKIDSTIITEGEMAADALTAIFGKGEANNNYCAALIYHYMTDAEDMSRASKTFNRKRQRKNSNATINNKTIQERAINFDEMYSTNKAFPVFALPHWLDQNQGILTKKSVASKAQYERLKDIFENVQTDLPVLLHKLLKAHDVVRRELGKDVIHGYIPLNDYGINKMITKMQNDEGLDMSYLEVDQIIKAVDSHSNISKEYGISSEQVYIIKAHFR